jgi:prepilin signal peptidase PulO-like enzyme (type II secretory pathway)
MEIVFWIIIFALGLCFGSFVNMLVYRTAKQYGILKNKKVDIKSNRSFCDYCGNQLSWYENIPVLSWLIQMGKTRCCQKKLPVSYPVVEIMMGILFLIFWIFWASHASPLQTGIGFVIMVLLVFSAVFDWKYMILPDFSTGILIICGLILIWASRSGGTPIYYYLLLALVSSGFLLIINLITKGKGMGMGDVKFAIFMGLFLGYPNIIIAFYVAFIVGAIYGVVLMIFKKAKKKSQVPFGPFLILGTLVAWFGGSNIISLVLSF